MCEYSIKHIIVLRDYARERGMVAPEAFWNEDVRVLREVYNGIGPDRWAPGFRKVITWLLKDLEAAALIHDWEYTFMPKTYWDFTKANLRLGWNAVKDHRFKLALPAAVACQLAGWTGYKEAGKE